jgi:circadian clock protein KaiC
MIEDIILDYRPDRIVVDPISALIKSGGAEVAANMIERLVNFFKERGLTAVFTSVSDPGSNIVENTPSRVSTIADAWIHLSFAAQGGERNRTLTVVKARGTGHSAQTREVVLDKDGITLTDVYSSNGAVLFGTARMEHEQRARAQRLDETRLIASELQQIDEESEALALRALQVADQIERLGKRRGELSEHAAVAARAAAADRAAIQNQRRADPEDENVSAERC